MTRRVVLDTETTGLSARLGDRIIEIGCVEILDRRLSGNNWHRYVNPGRKSEEGALAVHGIADEFLLDKPKFAEVAGDLLEYLKGAELVIHNAAFDVEFLDLELQRLDLPPLAEQCAGVIDTLKLAKQLHPGKRNSLDALCDRYEIDNSHRTLHGALLDAELLAEVYLAMTRGQDSLLATDGSTAAGEASVTAVAAAWKNRPALRVLRASAEELTGHRRLLDGIDKASKGKCVWKALEAPGHEGAATPGASKALEAPGESM